MHRLSARRARHVLLLASLLLVAGGSCTALATTASYSGDATTLIITGGDDANHELQFRFVAGRDEIIDTQPFTAKPGDCTFVVDPTWISCPPHVNAQVDLGAGNDSVTFSGSQADCFNGYTVNLGEGANTLHLHDTCPINPVETATVTGGSGPDELHGGNQATITFNAGDGADSLHGGSGNDIIHGGGGNDRMFGGAGNDQVLGEDGSDEMNGGAGSDALDGGTGDDGLERCSNCIGTGNDSGAGADTYVGGLGTDKLWLDAHPGGVAITLNGAADDGSPGEGDNVGADIEAFEGTTGNDSFTGTAGADNFSGNSGNDEIHGGDGPDDLYGGGGDDRVFGERGADRVQGGPFADTVDGGAGVDQIYGDIAGCSVFCSVDPDTLLARDGEKDTVDCGGGADSAVVDFDDVVAFCAAVDRTPAPPVVCGNCGTPVFKFPTFSATTVGKLKIAKPLSVVVRCSAACQYKVAIVLSARLAKRYGLGRKAVTVGSASGKLRAAGKATRRITLSAAARRKLRRAASVAATLRITLTQAGKTTSKSRTITLRK